MFTPQQIEQICFTKQTFGGYNMDQVDEFLEPLTEDYVTLYKENALLKSKMRVLVGKLEEYRKNEAAMKDAIVNAQRTCDAMVREAEAKCAQMLSEANATASQNAANADALAAAEEARVEEARRAAVSKIEEIEDQMRACLQALDRIKTANRTAAPAPVKSAYDFDSEDISIADAMADEISQSLEALVGIADEPAPKAEPKHPVKDSTTSRFANMSLQFGRNYDPNK